MTQMVSTPDGAYDWDDDKTRPQHPLGVFHPTHIMTEAQAMADRPQRLRELLARRRGQLGYTHNVIQVYQADAAGLLDNIFAIRRELGE